MSPNTTFVPPAAGSASTAASRNPARNALAQARASPAPLVSAPAPIRAPAATSSAALRTQLAAATISSKPEPHRPAGAPAGTIVVLFRSDLRVDDHAPLLHATEEAACVVPVFCFDPRHFERTAYGFEKTGKYRACFLLDSVKELRKTFQEMGADLIVRIGKPEEVAVDICKRVGAKRVFLHTEATYEEQQVEDGLEESLRASGSELKRFWGNTLYHTDDLPFDMDRIPDVYTDFRECVEKNATPRPPLKAPTSLAPLPAALDAGNIPTLADLCIDDSPDASTSSINTASSGIGSIKGGEPEAMRRVHAYVEESRRADADLLPRSRVSPHLGADFSCRISPWLALGCVSPRRIYQEMRSVALNPDKLTKSATYFELVWRDFFRFITCKYSQSRLSKSSKNAKSSKVMALAH